MEPKAGRPRCRWLIVVDDLADPTVMNNLWPPLSPTGRTLITTRRQDPALLARRHLITASSPQATPAPTSQAYLPPTAWTSRTVAATWSLSVEHADTLRPAGLARPMLHLAAFLDPNGIPDTVLTSAPALAYLAHHRSPGQPDDATTATSADQTHPPPGANALV